MLSFTGLGLCIIGAIMLLVDQGRMYFDARTSTELLRADVSAMTVTLGKENKDLREGIRSVFDRQLEIERTLAKVEVEHKESARTVEEQIARFTKEQAKLRETIAPRQPNPKLAAAKKYDGAQMKAELEKIRRKFDALGKKTKVRREK